MEPTWPVARPDIGSEEASKVLAAVKSGWISSKGPFILEFEEGFAGYVGTRHGVSSSNGTTALHLGLLALGVGPGDEVIVPSLTFVASANVVRYCGAKPVFVDSDPRYWCMDPDSVRKKISRRTKAIMPVHLYGHPCDMDPILELARSHGLAVVEDCAEAHGALYKGRQVGNFGEVSCFSFYGNKIITSIPGDEKVVVLSPEQTVQIVPIGMFAEKDWRGYSCLAFDKENKVGFRPITGFVAHPCDEEILTITLQGGKIVRVTKSHSLFALRDGQIRKVEAGSLKAGDFVVCPKRVTAWDPPRQRIDLMGPLSAQLHRFGVYHVGEPRAREGSWRYKHMKRQERNKLNQERAADAVLHPNLYEIRGNSYRGRPVLDVDEDFAEFLGYFIAEGSFGSTGVVFTFGPNEMELAERVKDLAKRLFLVESRIYGASSKITVALGGRILAFILEQVVGTGRGAANKAVPPCILSSPRAIQRAFLNAFLLGDGSVRRDRKNSPYDETAKTVSKVLAEGLQFICLANDIPFTLGLEESHEREFRLAGRKWHVSKVKTAYIFRMVRTHSGRTMYDFIPVKEGLVRYHDVRQLRNFGTLRKTISRQTLSTLTKDRRLLSLANSDISFIKVQSVNQAPFGGYVYDFEVAGYENFVGGWGMISLHNTGEGGMSLTNDRALADKMRMFRDHGVRGKRRYWHEVVGYNYRMTNLNAALGVAQLKKIDRLIQRKRRIASTYEEALKGIPTVTTAPEMPWARSVFWLYSILVEKGREKLMRTLAAEGVETRPFFYPIHRLPPYREVARYPVAERLARRGMNLPSGPAIEESDILSISSRVLAALRA